jgi:opacity protein-like surface antigen
MNSFKVIDGVSIPLTEAEVAETVTWLAAANMGDYQRVLGVNAAGEYLGYVAPSAAHSVVATAPPNGDNWRYDFATSTWAYVFGVDAEGKYVGNLPASQCVTFADSAPPDNDTGWRWHDAAWHLDSPSQTAYERAIQAHVDTTARGKLYADGVSCASYATSTVAQWAAEAAAFVAWRDQVWAYAYNQLYAVAQGQRTQPTIAALIAELPAITWPAPT